ncbi:unnamed protein product, partial [Discosporangium mesarthrocarpum]
VQAPTQPRAWVPDPQPLSPLGASRRVSLENGGLGANPLVNTSPTGAVGDGSELRRKAQGSLAPPSRVITGLIASALEKGGPGAGAVPGGGAWEPQGTATARGCLSEVHASDAPPVTVLCGGEDGGPGMVRQRPLRLFEALFGVSWGSDPSAGVG